MTRMSGSPTSPLLQPLHLGAREIPNRIVFGAHVTNFGVGNVFTPRHRAYYRERAVGGAGLIVTEGLTVHALDWPYEHIPFGHCDEIVPSLHALAEEVRLASGGATRLVAQLSHTGGQTHGRLLRQSPWAPSAVPDVSSRKMPRVMEADHIEQVVRGFGAAAARVAQAGLDGVELNAAQYSLLRQFLSPLTNLRGDDYGGALENRLRLLLRVVAVVRTLLGPGRILGVKLCGDELAPWGGLTPEHAAEIAAKLVGAGGVDYLSVQIGGPYSAHITDAGMPMPEAHGAAASAAIRNAVCEAVQPHGVPVFLEGRIDRIETAEAVLQAGQADAIVMTRALISDPDLPRKVAGAAPEPIRPQVGMNRYFVVKGDWNRPLGDLANPRAGREETLPPVEALPRNQRERVLVIGGGPAGLEAAGTLARLGHRVTLAESRGRLGGLATLLAETVTARAEFAPLVAHHEHMLERLGVEIRLNTLIAGGEPWLSEFARIYVATGASAPPPLYAVPNALPLWTPRALLEPDAPARLPAPAAGRPSPAAGRALVIDSEFGYRMANSVERLLALGFGVDVIAEDFFIGREVVESAELLWFSRVAAAGVGLYPRLRVLRVETDAVVASDRFSRQERRFAPVSLLVHSAPEVPNDALAERLRQRNPQVITIGDARAPRLMGEAILHAHKTVREI
jgi:2,4-dienoyl-CoA reductase-like NADH-dependent reductase (Old Yellow Enzyme family)